MTGKKERKEKKRNPLGAWKQKHHTPGVLPLYVCVGGDYNTMAHM